MNNEPAADFSLNKPQSITRGTSTISFDHDPEHQRFRQVSASGSTLYLADAWGSGAYAERVDGTGGSEQWNNYLVAGGEVVGMEVERISQPTLTRYPGLRRGRLP